MCVLVCIMLHAGTNLFYDFAYFFRWYGMEKMSSTFNLVRECTVVSCDAIGGTMIVTVELGEEVQFTEIAYSLCRCAHREGGSWNLCVAVDPKLITMVLRSVRGARA